MVVLIDSNVMIGFLKNDESAIAIFRRLVDDKELLSISSISVYEISLGIIANLYLKKGRPAKVPELIPTCKQVLLKVDVLNFTRGAAERAGEIRAQSLGKGLSIKEKDCQIAGIALEHGVDRVITHDESDFKKIFDLTGLNYKSF